MKNGEILPALEVLKVMGDKKAKTVDFALSLIELQEVLTDIHEKNIKAIKMAVQFTEEELQLQQQIDEIIKEFNNKTSQEELIKKIQDKENESLELSNSLKVKIIEFNKLGEELMGESIEETLPSFNKTDLPEDLTINQIKALKPILKT